MSPGDYVAVNFFNEPFRGRPINMNNRRQCFNVTIENDDRPEDAEIFIVIIRNSIQSDVVIVDPDVVTITILDTDSKRDLKSIIAIGAAWQGLIHNTSYKIAVHSSCYFVLVSRPTAATHPFNTTT